MNIYKEMYYKLFNCVTDIIEKENPTSENIILSLKKAQADTEDMFIEYESDE